MRIEIERQQDSIGIFGVPRPERGENPAINAIPFQSNQQNRLDLELSLENKALHYADSVTTSSSEFKDFRSLTLKLIARTNAIKLLRLKHNKNIVFASTGIAC